ncbi:GNAT family N-acetyltransferase [Thioclava sp. BHET1]|nr:GNAT family N-acetyltransferase [Thioclava sp. BHET1]
MRIRQATEGDAAAMSGVLTRILADWGSSRRGDAAHVREFYIRHPDRIACHAAFDADGVCLGFQSLKLARAGNAYGVEPGWGIIGSYVGAQARGLGVGRALFAASLTAARAAGLPSIDATIGAQNAAGLAYYGAMGFQDYRRTDASISKRYDIADADRRL